MQDSVRSGSGMDLSFGFEPEANLKLLLCAAEIVEKRSGGNEEGIHSVGVSVSDKISDLRKKGRLVYSGCCPFCDPDQYDSDNSVVARAGSRRRKAQSLSAKLVESCGEKCGVMSGCCVSDDLVVARDGSRKIKAQFLSVKVGESCDEKSGVMSGCCVSSSCDGKSEPFSLPVKKRKAGAGVSFPVPTVEDVGDVKPKDLVLKKKAKLKNARNIKKSTSCSKQKKNSDDIGQIGIPEHFKTRIQSMGGTDIVLVIQKELFGTDVMKGNNRLSMPSSQHISEFLRDAEKEWLKEKGEDGHWNVIEAPLLDPMLREKPWKIALRKWVMGKATSATRSQQYVLSKPWMDVVMANQLKAGDTVQVWAFRVGDQLCFALVKVNVC